MMSKLGLNRCKQGSTSTGSSLPNEEPPDKKRRTDQDNCVSVPGDTETWGDDDDEFDVILTQNMNQLDKMVASSCHIDNNVFEKMPPVTVGKSSSMNSCEFSPALNTSAACKNKPLQGQASSVATSLSATRPAASSLMSTSINQIRKDGIVSSVHVATSSNHSISNGYSSQNVAHPSLSTVKTATQYFAGSGHLSNVGLCEATHDDSKLPTSEETGMGSCSLKTIGDKAEHTRLAEECEAYKTKNEHYAKDGQIKMLREKYNRAQAELSRQKQEALRNIERQAEEKSRKEHELRQEVDRLHINLQFKERELTELRDSLKKLERRSSSMSTVIPVPSGPEVHRSPSTASFLGHFDSLQLQSTSPHKAPSASSVDHSSAGQESRRASDPSQPSSRCMAMKLLLPQQCSKGHLSGSHIIGLLLRTQSENAAGSLLETSVNSKTSPKSPKLDIATQHSQVLDVIKSSCSIQSDTELNRLANLGCQALLSSESKSDSSSSTSAVCGGLLASSNPGTVLFLPQIEDLLRTAVNQQLTCRLTCTQSSRTAFSLTGRSSDSASKTVTMAALHDCLRRLHSLVVSSRHVRQAIIGSGFNTTVAGDTSNLPNATLVSQANVSSLSILSTSRIMPCIERTTRNCRILELLVGLANPLERQWQPSVVKLCLDILVQLADSCDVEHLKSFMPLIHNDVFISCLHDLTVEDCDSTSAHFAIICRLLRLLAVVIRSPVIFQSLCSGRCIETLQELSDWEDKAKKFIRNASGAAGVTGVPCCSSTMPKDDECVLSAVYSFCSAEYCESLTPLQTAILHELMIGIISSAVSSHRHGAKRLLSSNCQCSSKVIRDLVFILKCRCDSYQTSSRSRDLVVLRKGLALLHTLALVTDVIDGYSFLARCSDINTEYILLMSNVMKILRKEANLPPTEVANIWAIIPESVASNSNETTDDDEDAHKKPAMAEKT